MLFEISAQMPAAAACAFNPPAVPYVLHLFYRLKSAVQTSTSGRIAVVDPITLLTAPGCNCANLFYPFRPTLCDLGVRGRGRRRNSLWAPGTIRRWSVVHGDGPGDHRCALLVGFLNSIQRIAIPTRWHDTSERGLCVAQKLCSHSYLPSSRVQ